MFECIFFHMKHFLALHPHANIFFLALLNNRARMKIFRKLPLLFVYMWETGVFVA